MAKVLDEVENMQIVEDGNDLFVEIDGVRIAPRGYLSTPQAASKATPTASRSFPSIRCSDIGAIEQQDCSMLDWTSGANGALLSRPGAP